jgi:hypothetical protein
MMLGYLEQDLWIDHIILILIFIFKFSIHKVLSYLPNVDLILGEAINRINILFSTFPT